MTSVASRGNISREGCIKQRFLKLFYVVFVSFLLFSPYAFFQAQAAQTPIPTAPEIPSLMIPPLVIVATLVGGLFFRKKIINGGEA